MKDEESKLWQAYTRERSIENRNALWLHYQGLAAHLSLRLINRRGLKNQEDDLCSEAQFALLHCIERFDPARGMKFSTFLTQRIHGSIFDFVRADTWMKRRDQYAVVIIRKFSEKLSREGLIQELMNRLKIKRAAAERYLSLPDKAANMVSLDTLQAAHGKSDRSFELATARDSAANEIEAREALAALANAAQLTEQQKFVLIGHDGWNISLWGLSVALGCNESRVSQVRQEALAKMRRQLWRTAA